jgi:ABC-type polysaccharide/polyol phosphate export permease
MASIISAYRDILYLGGYPAPDFLIRTAITAVVFLVFGYIFFRRFAPRFGEEL